MKRTVYRAANPRREFIALIIRQNRAMGRCAAMVDSCPPAESLSMQDKPAYAVPVHHLTGAEGKPLVVRSFRILPAVSGQEDNQ